MRELDHPLFTPFMMMPSNPYLTLLSSCAAYTSVLYVATSGSWKTESAELRKSMKTVSSLHSTATTILALYTLNYASWSIKSAEQKTTSAKETSQNRALDDSQNPIISATSILANRLTAWETGYLVYDTGALLLCSYVESNKNNLRGSSSGRSKGYSVFLAHHLALVAALGYLQTYIAAGREKGLWVIVAFMLMNVSNPFLHLRWLLKKKHGRVDMQFDLLFAAVFAVSRLGVVAWVLRKYGAYHSLSTWQAYSTLRLPCKLGVTTLVSVNAIWWVGLLRKLAEDVKGLGS